MSQAAASVPAAGVVPSLPSYLGVIEHQSSIPILGQFACADCKHDFSHAKTTISYTDAIKSYSPSYGLSVVKFQKSGLKIKQQLNEHTNAYSFFGDYLHHILPGPKISKQDHKDEDAITESVGLDLGSYRDKLIIYGNNNFTNGPYIDLGTIPINGNIQHNYQIHAYSTKIRSTKLSIRGALRTVAPTSNVFVMIIDATFISMTEIKKTLNLSEYTKEPIIVYIIRSVENTADPATKISNIEQEDNNITIFYLDDEKYISTSPPFNDINAVNQMSNLFTTLSVTCYRKNDGTITADIIKTDGSIITIDDIGSASEINKAASLAFQQLIIEHAKTNSNLTLASWEEILVFILLKRSGDWRQALCLLDRDRKYYIKDINNQPVLINGSPFISLNDLLTQFRNQIEIFLMTHDRILLAYALYLGLNVGYSLRTPITSVQGDESQSVTWLLYFKNIADATISPEYIVARYETLKQAPGFSMRLSLDTLYTSIIERISAIQPISLLNFEQYSISIRLLYHFIKQITPRNIVTTLLKAIDTKIEIIETKGTNGQSFFSELLQLETEIKTVENIYKTHTDVIRKIEEYISGQIDRVSIMPSTFIEEHNNIIEVKKLLDNGISIFNPNNGPVTNYHIFKMKTLASACKDYKQIMDIREDPFYNIIKERLTPIIQPTLTDISQQKRVQQRNWRQLLNDIESELGFPKTQFGGGYAIQSGGGVGDVALLDVQQNIINLRENIRPYDLTEAKELLMNQYSRTPERLPVLTNILEFMYHTFIGKVNLNEPYYTDFILDCIDRIPPEAFTSVDAIFITENVEGFIALSTSYPLEPLYNKLEYGTSFVENNLACTIADRYIISEKEGRKLHQIVYHIGTRELNDNSFENPHSKTFILYRYPLYILDKINNKIDTFEEIDESDEKSADSIFSYEDITYEKIKKYHMLLLYIDSTKDNWNHTNILQLYECFEDRWNQQLLQTFLPQMDRLISKRRLKELCSVLRIKFILRYHDSIGKRITTEEILDLFINIMPSWITWTTIAGILQPGTIRSINDIIAKSIQYIMTNIEIGHVYQIQQQGPTLLNARPGEDIPNGLVSRFIYVCVSTYYCSHRINYHDKLHNNVILLGQLFSTIRQIGDPVQQLVAFMREVSDPFIKDALAHGLIIISIEFNIIQYVNEILRMLYTSNILETYNIISDVYLTYSLVNPSILNKVRGIILSIPIDAAGAHMNEDLIIRFCIFKNIELPSLEQGPSQGGRKRWPTRKSSRSRRKKTMCKQSKKQKRKSMRK